jgi:uncharacterized protein
MTEFTPIASLIGGAMIGLAAVLYMLFQGRIAGISGISVRMFPPYLDRQTAGRIAFILGLVLAADVYVLFLSGDVPVVTIGGNKWLLAAGGLIAGFGAVWGNGCTSGHGVCGLSRLSVRSLVAVCVFMATAAITVFLVRHVFN